jgi:hypothetical protein
MTTYQSNSNGYIAQKVQSALGTLASGTGAKILRTAGGAGAKLAKAATESNEVRRDGMRQRGRHGTQKTTSAYTMECSLGSHDDIVEAISRDTWSAADLTLTQSDFTSLTTGANAIVFASGDPRSLGLRVGEVIDLINFASTANDLINIRITALSSTTITTAETLIVNATPDTSCSIVRRGKKLVPYAGGSLIKRYFTLEEYEADIDQSTVVPDFVWGSIKFSMGANGLLMADSNGVGTGQFQVKPTGSAPYYTTPTATIADPFAVVDATIRLNGADLVALTSLDVTVDIGPTAPDVFGSGAIKYAPDVFTGQMAVSLNLGMLRPDLTILSDFAAETAYSLHILAVENEAEPKDFFSIYVPNFTLGGADPSALSKQGGGRTQSISVPAALVGIDNRGTGYDASMIKFQTTAA